MSRYTELELEEAKASLTSTLRKCEKIQEGGKLQSSQKTLNDRRVNALKIALAMIEREMEGGKMATKNVAAIEIKFASFDDVPQWMSLVDIVEDHFPGLDKDDYQKSLLECIQRKEALCAKTQGRVVGVLLFSIAESILAFLAVHPEFRKCGIATDMVKAMIAIFPKDSNIWVTTFREDDKKGDAARALYLRCGFMADELVVEMDYPCQKFVLRRE